MKAYLILEDGTRFAGESIGAKKDVISEIVFNTSMTGYPEILTDPSYAGQAVCLTYPLIGNYGICREDLQSSRPWPDALIVRECSRMASNFRSDITLQDYLEQYEIPGIAGIDTRALTKVLREKGTMNGMITTRSGLSYEEIRSDLEAYRTGDVVQKVSCRESYDVKTDQIQSREGEGLKVALLDVGMKKDIALSLAGRGLSVKVYPAWTKAEEILKEDPDGIMISNGPGDPKECGEIIGEIAKLSRAGIPIFAICLGHQLMALAHGGDTHRLKYGHRGGNHPVKDRESGRVYITSQNHGYVVDEASLPESVASAAFTNVNDGTNEGLSYQGKKIFTVQFHPEASPGPQDTSFLFDRFIKAMKG
ncbi:MAG: carbamoyl phosphate synthase small subunit [Lachnospiraceae bacterium]|nr:carbamoyl phosphate synthase small subunit [Lachnospiraceae bacterium]